MIVLSRWGAQIVSQHNELEAAGHDVAASGPYLNGRLGRSCGLPQPAAWTPAKGNKFSRLATCPVLLS
jgi:hypothetical protein